MLCSINTAAAPLEVVYRQLYGLAYSESTYADPRLSDYQVGTALLLQNGKVYVGVNNEGPNIGLTIHGEMSAINGAIAMGEKRAAIAAGFTPYNWIKAIAVVARKSPSGAWPCGFCRDCLWAQGADIDVIVANEKGDIVWSPMRDVLPYSVAPEVLIQHTRSADLMQHLRTGSLPPQLSRAEALSQWENGSRPTSKQANRNRHFISPATNKEAAFRDLLALSNNAAQLSYCPYSARPAGGAVWLYDGTVVTGARSENVGYTLSEEPEIAALNAAISSGALARARQVGVGTFGFIRAVAYSPLGLPNVWPGGASRQILCDYGVDIEVVIGDDNGQPVSLSLDRLLPKAFTPSFLSSWTGRIDTAAQS